jgi:hypothetical protein
VKDLVHKPDAGRLERILIRQFDVDLPNATSERSWTSPTYTRPTNPISKSVAIIQEAEGRVGKKGEITVLDVLSLGP